MVTFNPDCLFRKAVTEWRPFSCAEYLEGLRKPSDAWIISVDLPLLIGRSLDGYCLAVAYLYHGLREGAE